MNHYLKQTKKFLEVAQREFKERKAENNQVETKDIAEKSNPAM